MYIFVCTLICGFPNLSTLIYDLNLIVIEISIVVKMALEKRKK